MNLVYFSDSHFRASRPSCRKDADYYPNQFAKLGEALRIALDNGGFVLHGGDFFHSHNSPLSLIYTMMGIFKDRKMEDLDFLVNPGNHDFAYGNTETISRSGVGVLQIADAVLEITEKRVRLLEEKEGIVLRSAPYMISYPEEFYWFDKKEPGKTYVVVAHDMLATKPCPFPHRQIKDLKTNADLVLCSHLHQQFMERHGSTWFVNAGPIDAQTVNERHIKPAVAVISIESGIVTPKFQFLKTTGYEEVEVADDEARDLGLADDFVRQVQGSQLAEGADFQQVVTQVAKESGYSDAAVQRVLDRLREAQTCAGRE